jgi:Protein of unknown function (DUF3037)
MSTEPRRFRLYVLRYVNDVPRQEFVNIGVCLAEWDDGDGRFLGFRFLEDWNRLHAFFPDADVDFIRDWCRGLAGELASPETRDVALRQLEGIDSTISVFVDQRAIESRTDPEEELHTVANIYLNGSSNP